jgi:2-succinyl-5-enolpyruvyl-6-hydroxy-3-cyclohexene-1-carboxylate synthase
MVYIEGEDKDDRWYSQRIINEAIEKSQYPECGPVHINIPLREPLYKISDYSNEPLPKVFSTVNTQLELPLS